MNNEIIDSLEFVPNAFKDNSVMLMVTELLNLLMDKNLNANYPNLVEMQAAYHDATYKMIDYSQVSFEAKKQIIHEMGFDYITDFINITDNQITQLLMFLNLIYILKGKKEGLQLILDTLGIVYEYTVWDETSPKGVPFTATLLITGGNFDDYNVLSRLKNFLRSYMLPWIDVVIQIVIDAPPLYIHPSHGRLMRLFDTTRHECSRDVDQRVAIYDLDDGHGYDQGLYGRNTTWGTDGEVPEPPPPVTYVTITINALPANVAVVEINGIEQTTLTVMSGTQIQWRVYAEGYVEQSGNFTITQDTTLNIELQEIEIPTVTLTITTTPANAKVRIRRPEDTVWYVTNSRTVDIGTELLWDVSADGYETQSGNIVMNKDEYLVVNLVAEPTVLFYCYLIHFQGARVNLDFSTYAYAPASNLSLNMPLYFKYLSNSPQGIACYADVLADNSSQLIQSPHFLFYQGNNVPLVLPRSPYITAYSDNIVTSASCVYSSPDHTWDFNSTSVTRLPSHDLYE